MINDIVSVFDQCCVCKLYADDLKLYMPMSIAGYAHTFQKCIDNLTLWSRTWQLDISHKECLGRPQLNGKDHGQRSLSKYVCGGSRLC